MAGHESAGEALIGPNAVLQLAEPIARHLGSETQRALFAQAGYEPMPSGEEMIPELGVARLHELLGQTTDKATAITIVRQAGVATAEYILARRIPAMAQRLLKRLPSALAARLLAKAIEKNAWTFAGSGTFRIVSNRPLILAIAHNPLAVGERAETAQCHWHCAVFATLFNTLAGNRWTVHETCCCAMGFDECQFVVASN